MPSFSDTALPSLRTKIALISHNAPSKMSLSSRSICMFLGTKFQINRSWTQGATRLLAPRSCLVSVGRGLRNAGNKTGQKPSLPPELDGPPKKLKDLTKPFMFTLFVTGSSFVGCSIWQYESIRSTIIKAKQIGHGNVERNYGKKGPWRMKFNNYWNKLSEGQKLGAGIIATNLAVFLAWRIPALRTTMMKYFLSAPGSRAPNLSLMMSSFSHISFLHLLCNMYVLWSFIPTVTNMLGREQFLAVYLSAGVISGFASVAVKIARKSPIPSLGASGAIMAVLGAFVTYHPDARLSIAFVSEIYPHSFRADSAVKTVILLDCIGVLMGWRVIDHAGHLGGMLFGLWYMNYGHKYIWPAREKLIRHWHKFRGPP